jgi:hypothetical protein
VANPVDLEELLGVTGSRDRAVGQKKGMVAGRGIRESDGPAGCPGRRRADGDIASELHEGPLESVTGQHGQRLVGRAALRDGAQVQLYAWLQQRHASGGGVEHDGERFNPYVEEHVNLIASIRNGTPINEGRQVAESVLTAIMAREAAYTSQVITWEEVLNAQQDLVPRELAFGPLPVPPIPEPGVTKLERTTFSHSMEPPQPATA